MRCHTHAITLTDSGLGVGLPLIPFVLIASRTRIFDSVLPVLPVIFFCHTDPLHFTLPPSPQITLALLPYIRSFYNAVWQHCIAYHEARWIKETTPKFALESAEEQQRQRQRQQQRQADANDAQQAGADVLEQNEWDVEVVLENNNLILQGSNVTSMILGALLWPSVAKIIGQSLTWLPAAWGVKKWLPTQLARNVAGGLMVVVLKVRVVWQLKTKLELTHPPRTLFHSTANTSAPRGSGADPFLITAISMRRREAGGVGLVARPAHRGVFAFSVGAGKACICINLPWSFLCVGSFSF